MLTGKMVKIGTFCILPHQAQTSFDILLWLCKVSVEVGSICHFYAALNPQLSLSHWKPETIARFLKQNEKLRRSSKLDLT
jgi:hypothetical protein